MLDVFGPAEVFADASTLHGESPSYEIEIVSAGDDLIVTSHIGAPLLTSRTYRDVVEQPDTLLVAGGLGARELRCAPEFLRWLADQSSRVRRIGSVCTGASVLAAAGLLDGRRATTHWNWSGELARRYPRVKVEADAIYVRDRHVYTSAGVTAGIDLALAMVEDDLGSQTALRVARTMVVFLRRPGGQSQFSATLAAQTNAPTSLSDLLAWLADHLDADLAVPVLARRAAMSPRNFTRVFTRQVGTTPARYIERMRVEAARRDLEVTSLSLEQIAVRVGLHDSGLLRRTFVRHLGVTPSHYRASFGRRTRHG